MNSYFVSSTDIAAIMGLSPYDSPVSLFLRKKGKIVPKKDESFQMKLGKKLEATMRDLLVEQEGIVVVSGNFDLRRHPERPEFIAVPDGFTNYKGEVCVVEQKAILHYVSHLDFYEVQLRWQMMVCQCNGLLVMLTPNELMVKKFERDISFEKKMIEAADWFLDLLNRDQLPSVDNYHPSTLDALKKMNRREESVVLADEYNELIKLIDEKKEKIKSLEEEIEVLQSKILCAMNDAIEARCGDYKIKVNKYTKKQSITINDFDDKVLELLKENNCSFKINEPCEIARLIISKKKGD